MAGSALNRRLRLTRSRKRPATACPTSLTGRSPSRNSLHAIKRGGLFEAALSTTSGDPMMARTRLAASMPAMACLSLMAAPTLADQDDGKRSGHGRTDPPGQLIEVQLLGFNDYHGHVLPDAAGDVDGVAAGGGAYLATKLKELRKGKKYSLTVAAGDLIGGSPAFSEIGRAHV